MKRRPSKVVEKIARADLADALPRSAPVDARQLGLELARALERNELRLHFQPIVDLRSGECRRVEALLRWRAKGGRVPPADLIAAAEATGQLPALARWVADAAALQVAGWRGQGLRLEVSINFAGPELQDAGLARDVIGLLRQRSVEPSVFTFEIGSGVLSAGDPNIRATLRELALAGGRIGLDHVSFADLPGRSLARDLDEIKLARSLVQRAVSDSSAERDARALVELARDYRLAAVAVGIEDRATLDLFAGIGCDLAQGHWLSRPLAAQRVRSWQRVAAGLAFSSTVAVTTFLAAPKASASGGLAQAAAQLRGLVPGICTCDLPGLPTTEATALELLRERTGRDFVAQRASRAEVYIESSVRRSERTRIARAADRDVTALEAAYNRSFSGRPAIYVFATRSSFAHGLQQVFGMRSLDAGMLASANGGITIPQHGAIAINLENIANDTELAIVRHELTHVLIHEIIGPDSTLPAWVDEGLATLQERNLRPDDSTTRGAAISLTLLAEGKLSLSDLASGRQWVTSNAALSGGAYGVAADAARLLEARVTPAGLREILELTGRGTTFDEAYASVAGESLFDFERNFGSRLLAEQEGARVLQRQSDADVVWTLAGFAAESEVEIVIVGSEYRIAYVVTTDRYGMFSGAFGTTAPGGDYTLTATGRGVTAQAVLRVGPSTPGS